MTTQLENYNVVVNYILHPLRIIIPFYDYLPLPQNIKAQKSLNQFREFLKKLIKEKQQKLNSSSSSSEKTNDILEVMIKCGNEEGTNLSDEELIQNLFLFFVYFFNNLNFKIIKK